MSILHVTHQPLLLLLSSCRDPYLPTSWHCFPLRGPSYLEYRRDLRRPTPSDLDLALLLAFSSLLAPKGICR